MISARWLVAAVGLMVGQGNAAPIVVGYLSFAADSPLPGQTSLSVINATGLTFGCILDAPVCDELSISGTLAVEYGPGDELLVALIGPLGAGAWLPPEFIFNDLRVPTRVRFFGSIAPVSFQVFGGDLIATGGAMTGESNFLAIAPEIFLFVDPDIGVAVPEPLTLWPVTLGMLVILACARLRPKPALSRAHPMPIHVRTGSISV